MTSPARVDIAELELAELEALIESFGIRGFHARQVFRWVHRHGVTNFDLMTDIGRPLAEQVASALMISTPEVRGRDVSSDGTTKFLLALADGQLIESVFIPDTPRQTLCISTQAGCAMKCAFCLTGRMGLLRNLRAGEIAGQVRVLVRELALRDRPFNIVLMGMGEPLHNYDATMKALRILADTHGLAVPPRRITLSTVGVLPALERLATEPLMPNLAVSLHATTDELRERLVPVSRKYGLADLLNACRRFPLKQRSRITFEYVLLAGVNDTPSDARRLATMLAGMSAKVNLIPLNEAAGIPFTRPTDDQVNRFAKTLADRGVTVMVRKSRGRDIRAACGQLIVEGSQPSPAQQLAEAMQGESAMPPKPSPRGA